LPRSIRRCSAYPISGILGGIHGIGSITPDAADSVPARGKGEKNAAGGGDFCRQ
jgi:hypothetical protein